MIEFLFSLYFSLLLYNNKLQLLKTVLDYMAGTFREPQCVSRADLKHVRQSFRL